jgi:hypothetical protein
LEINMRELTSTLLNAQKQAVTVPYVKIVAVNKIGGVVRQDWTRLYTGFEPDYFHALAIPADGSLIRARITPPDDARRLYRQRVAGPGPGSDYTQWTYTSQYNAVAVAAASLGAEVSIFWINTSREVRRIRSTNNGASWSSPELLDYSLTTAVYGLAAAYKPGGDLAIFFADQATLYVKKYIGGVWQSKAAWDKTTGDLSGVAAVYDGDWDLLVTGQDSAGNYKLWSLVYGDGGEVAAGSWSMLKEVAAAPSGGDFEYRQPFLDRTDVCRCFYIERFTGSEAYDRPFWTNAVPGSGFAAGLWREPAPFNLSSEYGLAMAHDSDYAWLTSPAGVWLATLTVPGLDLTVDVTAARQKAGEAGGGLTVELANDDGKYAAPGEDDLAVLDIGCQIDFSPGYVTSAGNESSDGLSFFLESYEHTSAGGKASLVLRAVDGWEALEKWQARHQFRWNKTADDTSVRGIIRFILARVGIGLEVISESSVITGFYPDFTVSPGDSGREVIIKLLSFVSDRLFIEGNTAYLVNPLATDEAVYGYGDEHMIFEGTYRRGALKTNRVKMEGYDTGMILVDSFEWEKIDRAGDRLRQVVDRNLTTVDEAGERGQAYLRRMEIEAEGGSVLIPVNCGQQLNDVIEITDERAGLNAAKKRVRGIVLGYYPRRGEYRQRLDLGAV